jgi:hypothetical protein
VFQSRYYPLAESDLPCLLIASESESVQYQTMHGPAEVSKTITVTIRGVAKATSGLDDTLDGICKEVEVVLATNKTGLLQNIRMTGTTITTEVTGDQPVGVATMTFEVDVYCLETTPDVAI